MSDAASLADEAIAAAEAAATSNGDAPAGPAVPAPAAADRPGTTPDAPPPARAPSLQVGKNVVAILIDQAFHTVWRRQARRAGLYPLSPSERAALHLSDDERDELETLAQGGVSQYLEKHADWIEKLSLAIFGFVLWSIYNDRRELIKEAAAQRAKSGAIDPAARNPFLRQPGITPDGPAAAVVVGPVPPGARGPGSTSAPAGVIDPTPRGKHA